MKLAKVWSASSGESSGVQTAGARGSRDDAPAPHVVLLPVESEDLVRVLRQQIIDAGFEVQQTPEGAKIKRKL